MKKATLKVRVTPEPADEVLRESEIPLTLDERVALKAAFQSSGFRRAWKNAQLKKPSVITGDLNTALGHVIANNRLHEIRGWEMFTAALLMQINDPVVKAPQSQETFPDSGMVVGEPPKKPNTPAYPKPPAK